jgi:hypothetical protein
MTFSPKKKMSKSHSHQRAGVWQKLTAKKILDRTALQYDDTGKAIGLAHFEGIKTPAKKTKTIKKVRA